MEIGTRPPIPLHPGGPPTPRTHPPAPPPLASGWAAFDALRLVQPGRVLLVDLGCRAASDVLMSLLASAVARGGDAVVVDGGNWLDVYDLGHAARAHGLRRDDVLAGVRIARGFTAYQLQSLVESALPQALEAGGVTLALASCLPEMYLDDDLARSEARVLVARAMRTLRDLARKHHIPVIVSNATLAPHERNRLRHELDEGSDDATTLLPAPHGGLRIAVRGRADLILATDPRTRQRTLTEFRASVRVDDASLPAGAFARHAIDACIRYAPKHAGELRAKQTSEGTMTLERIFVAEGA